jgi:hypothetical protein
MWTDSEIALCLVHANRQVDVFVDNRVQKIKELKAQWRHIPSAQNSANVTSRGMSASDYLTSDLYWKGP